MHCLFFALRVHRHLSLVFDRPEAFSCVKFRDLSNSESLNRCHIDSELVNKGLFFLQVCELQKRKSFTSFLSHSFYWNVVLLSFLIICSLHYFFISGYWSLLLYVQNRFP